MRGLCRVWAPSEQMHESKERTALSKLDSQEQTRKGVELKINFSTSGYCMVTRYHADCVIYVIAKIN